MQIQIPVAKKQEVVLEKHQDMRIDAYHWMNQRENPDVLAYLEQENAYYKQMSGHTKGLQEDLFQQMKARIKEDDTSVPYKYNGYWYITRFEKGQDYPIYTRKKESLQAEEEVLLNVNTMAKDHAYIHVTGLNVSQDNTKISFGVDTVSRRIYTIFIKDLQTDTLLDLSIENTTGSAVWAADNQTLFYTRKDEKTLRSDTIFRQNILRKDSEVVVYHETDDTFSVYVYKTKSKEFIVIGSASTLTSEFRFIPANTPEKEFDIFTTRERGLEYDIAHYKDHFYIITNIDGATNFKLMRTSVTATSKPSWQEVIPHREDVLLEDIEIFKDFLVISERSDGLNKIRIKRWDNTQDYYLPFDNETYTAYVGANPEFDTSILRYGYNALTTPPSVIAFDMQTKEKEILKEQEVLDTSFSKDNYISERIWAKAQDGTLVPMSIVYKKGTPKDGTAPLLQYAYGSYGATIDPYFSSNRLSLLDRGFIYVIAHVRGSEYLGRPWYENGKLLHKKNTFTDFIACSEHLIAQKYTSAQHLYAMGGSAGGLLIGAVINMAPDLYKGVVAQVPFVDVVTTMLDDTIPLTTGEYDEWGNPNDKTFYTYMKSYSPYDNVTKQAYPNMLVTTGFHDSQVQYWEPAKWVAKLRELKTDTNVLFFDINMDAGHGGASGRFEGLKEVAKEYAFLLSLEDINS